MRGAWLAVLLIGGGCRAVPETASGSRVQEIASSTQLPSSTANLAAAQAEIVQVAFWPELEPVSEGGDDSVPGQSRPTSQDNAGLMETEPTALAAGVESDANQPLRPEASAYGLRNKAFSSSQDNAASQGQQPVYSTMPISLTLQAAIQIALERNPDLIAIRSSEPVARATHRVAGTYPFNPQFQTQVLPYTRDRAGHDAAVSQQHVIVQTFELAHQRRFRTGAAAAEWERVRGNIRAAELTSAAQTERFFFAILYQRELRDLARSLAELNADLVEVLERRLKAGQANYADVALARLQSQSARHRQLLMEANYQTALTNLSSYLNLAEGTHVDPIGAWLQWHWQSVANALRGTDHESLDGQTPGFGTDQDDSAFGASVRRLVAQRGDVAAARAGVAMASKNLALAEAMRRPNLQIGPLWQRDDAATEFWGIQAQMDIPVVNTGTPLVRQRRAELQQQQVTAERLEEKAVSEARAAVARYERARRLVDQSRGDFAQAMPDALKFFEDQFQAGQITLLEVFAARTSLAQSRQSLLDLLNELALAAADVTKATGLSAQQLILDPPAGSDETRTVPIP
jgi:cobalt-zinc-cadmium efflux system outer membrane protein